MNQGSLLTQLHNLLEQTKDLTCKLACALPVRSNQASSNLQDSNSTVLSAETAKFDNASDQSTTKAADQQTTKAAPDDQERLLQELEQSFATLQISLNEKLQELHAINEMYSGLEKMLQKNENDLRKHIKNEQQLRLYAESLQEKLNDSEEQRNELLENTKLMILDIKRDNNCLSEKVNELQNENSRLMQQIQCVELIRIEGKHASKSNSKKQGQLPQLQERIPGSEKVGSANSVHSKDENQQQISSQFQADSTIFNSGNTNINELREQRNSTKTPPLKQTTGNFSLNKQRQKSGSPQLLDAGSANDMHNDNADYINVKIQIEHEQQTMNSQALLMSEPIEMPAGGGANKIQNAQRPQYQLQSRQGQKNHNQNQAVPAAATTTGKLRSITTTTATTAINGPQFTIRQLCNYQPRKNSAVPVWAKRSSVNCDSALPVNDYYYNNNNNNNNNNRSTNINHNESACFANNEGGNINHQSSQQQIEADLPDARHRRSKSNMANRIRNYTQIKQNSHLDISRLSQEGNEPVNNTQDSKVLKIVKP